MVTSLVVNGSAHVSSAMFIAVNVVIVADADMRPPCANTAAAVIFRVVVVTTVVDGALAV